MKKIVVVGEEDMALGFSLAGANEVFTPEDDYEAKKRIDKLLESPDVAVILLSEAIAEDIRSHLEEKQQRKDDLYPVIVEIPGKEGPVEGKEDPLEDKIKRAVGIDITQQEESS
ncbi:MAG: V-type ATP synthase subunit F [Candidatus Thermoplasmatota archaeon]|nr:V-type ATP synthase subunit F [Candidatus Thermoplasmatota archaeon]